MTAGSETRIAAAVRKKGNHEEHERGEEHESKWIFVTFVFFVTFVVKARLLATQLSWFLRRCFQPSR